MQAGCWGTNMPNVLVRDVEISVLEKLKARAARKGRSLQSEVQMILHDAADVIEALPEIETARKIRASLAKRQRSESSVLLREDRRR